MMTTNPTACLILIGNEILSGRTKDKNLSFIGQALNSIGIQLREARVIPDIEQTIIDTVNECRQKYTYIFTTGGIGPTHDDITTASIAKAFDVPVMQHPEAERRLLAYYKPEDVNEARMKMAHIPVGAELIDNPVSAAPGFKLENVYVLAGVPSICEAMIDFLKPKLAGGLPMLTHSLEVDTPEGDVADGVTAIDAQYDDVEIGIYPMIKHGQLACNIVLRSIDGEILQQAAQVMKDTVARAGGNIINEQMPTNSA